MYASKLPSLLLLLHAVFLPLVVAGPANSFCGLNPLPTAGDCQTAINRINKNQYYSGGTKIMAGDCTVEVVRNLGSDAGSIRGSDFQAQALDILTDGCKGDGWCKDSNVNVTVHQCRVCMYGVCATCKAPRLESDSDFDPTLQLPLPEIQDRLVLADAHTVAHVPEDTLSSDHVLSNSPEHGVTCGSAFNPPPVGDCHALANSLRGRTLTLPFISVYKECELAIFAHIRGLGASGDRVADRISHDTDICASSGVVGRQTDTTQEVPLVGYEIWFGSLCGEFGFGLAGCAV